jgi:hypothetical protein
MTTTEAGGYKITLSQAMRSLKKAKGSSINQNEGSSKIKN